MWAVRSKDSKHDGRTFSLETRYDISQPRSWLVETWTRNSPFLARECLLHLTMGGVFCFLLSTAATVCCEMSILRLHLS
jgi:hypothetical protein